ncbi:MAG: ferritin-like domain-containing protein [Clostridiales bacterium]
MDNQDYYADQDLIRMLREALAGEKMALRNYDILLNAAGRPEDKAQINKIRRDERRHYLLLEEIYESLTGKEYPPINAPASMPKNYCDMVKTSICDELEAAVFHEKLACRLNCIRHKEIICKIINDEKEHARILASIYKKCSR